MGIYSISGLPSNLTYELTDYDLHDKLCDTSGNCTLGATKVFSVTIKYADGGYDSSNTTYNIKLDFEFRKMHQVTYTGITNNNYPTSVIDGGTLTFTVTSNIPPKIVAFTTTGDRYSYDLYSYVSNKFTFNNVSGDVVLKYQDKAYMTVLSTDTYFKESTYKNIIDSVYFVDYVDTSNAVKTYDLSENSGAKDVIGWITSGNDLYIGSDWNIYSYTLANAFQDMSSIQIISFDNLNTSETTSMYYMFSGCSSLVNLDLSSFKTSKVTNMARMFSGCTSLPSIDVSSFDVSKVQFMYGMFGYMSSLKSLNLSNFVTSSVTSMFGMFQDCSGIEFLDISNFDTKKVTRMDGMFKGMKSLTSLDLSHFYTPNLNMMLEMFYGMSSLTSLNVSNFDTSNVTDMYGVFSNVSLLKSLNLNSFDTSNVTRMSWMFQGCSSLTELNLKNFNTSKVTNMNGMFLNLHSITKLDLSSFNTSNVTAMGNMFNGLEKVETLDIRNFSFDNVTLYGDFGTHIPSSATIIAKDDAARTWLQDKLGSGKGTIVTVAEL